MTTGGRRKPPVNPVKRRRQNHKDFWEARYKAVGNDYAEMSRVAYERARSAAKRAVAAGEERALYELAELLTQWSLEAERANERRL